MLLSKKDIHRLEAKGYSIDHFAKYDRKGYVQLRNRDGYCIFYDIQNHQCKVYADRPSGCRVYPVIFDEEKGVVLDGICESRESVSEQEKRLKGKRVVKLLAKIDSEAIKRRC
jgi:Fe-S-cluster containining protein